jgi:hypothetical protein
MREANHDGLRVVCFYSRGCSAVSKKKKTTSRTGVCFQARTLNQIQGTLLLSNKAENVSCKPCFTLSVQLQFPSNRSGSCDYCKGSACVYSSDGSASLGFGNDRACLHTSTCQRWYVLSPLSSTTSVIFSNNGRPLYMLRRKRAGTATTTF